MVKKISHRAQRDPRDASGYQPTPPYPHLVIRYMNACYGRLEVTFGETRLPTSPGVLEVACAVPETGVPLAAEKRAAVVSATLKLVENSGFFCCAVFGERDAVFCEPDGITKHSTDPPSGGIRLDHVENTPTGPISSRP